MPQAVDYGKVAVLMGGTSAEREISLISGKAVYAALRRQQVDAHIVDPQHDSMQVLAAGQFERAFVILHGRGGEDGTMQGVLETLRIPYTGSGVLGSALAMDKLRTKQVWHGLGLPTPRWQILHADSDSAAIVADLGLPLFVKPVLEGSSVGISKVHSATELAQAWQTAQACHSPVIVEQFIDGLEYTAGIVGTQSLPLIRLETPHDFYDYSAKYTDNTTQYHCPCGLPAVEEQTLQQLAWQAFQAVGASGWGRVDMMYDRAGKPYLLEVNTAPGMTDHSLVPMAAQVTGIDFDSLVLQILDGAGLAEVKV